VSPNGKDRIPVTINGQQVEAEPGRMLIDVAEEMGVFVPRFCYHPGMKSVAVCRMCLVKVEGQRKLLPACATPVTEGMVADTVDAEAVDAQQGMLEFLLINHPLDCPICDRGGECPLQDQTYRHGPGSSRYIEPKRTYEKALEISDLVVLDRERCVLCWRCVRFSDEIAGDQFIQLVDRGAGTQILTFNDEPFDSYFSGNTIQICPVGALTSKPYRFVSRPWDLKSAPSVCSYCSVGCPITNEARNDQVVRCQALPNENVNDFWSCDKGRFGYHYLSSPERLSTPLVRDEEGEFQQMPWGQAFRRAAEGLKDKKRIGVIAGGHLTTEDAYAVSRLAKGTLGTTHVDSRIQDDGAPYELAMRLEGTAGSTATITDLEDARTIVWSGPDPKEVVPVLYLRLRKAVRERGAKLIVVGPRRISLDDIATHVLRVAPGEEAAAIDGLTTGPEASDIGDPLIVCWGQASPGRDESDIFDSLLKLAQGRNGKLLMCPPHAGSQGLIDMGVYPTLDAGYAVAPSPGMSTRQILTAAARGELDALVLVGADPIGDFPDQELALDALDIGVFTIAIEIFPTESAVRADILLPATAYAERQGTFTNLERRLQKLEKLVDAPGSSRDGWEILQGIARAAGDDWGWRSFDDVWKDIRAHVPTHADVDVQAIAQTLPAQTPQYETGLETAKEPGAVAGPGGQYPKGYRSGTPFQTGQNWPLSWELRQFEARQRPGRVPVAPGRPADVEHVGGSPILNGAGSADTFKLQTGRMIYDEGTMISKTAALRGISKKAFVEMNDRDVKRLGLSDGDEVVVGGNGARFNARLVIADIAEGSVFVPYDQQGMKASQLMTDGNLSVTVMKA
jgi:NADH-quinone oxidoreductase subunit G